METTVESRESFTILHLKGEFDRVYCPLFEKEVDELIAAGVRRVVVNLQKAKFIDSTALGAIIRASRALDADGGGLVTSCPTRFVREIMERAGLDRVVPIYDTDEAAGSSLQA